MLHLINKGLKVETVCIRNGANLESHANIEITVFRQINEQPIKMDLSPHGHN